MGAHTKPLKVQLIFGTRPEAIKLFPLILALRNDERFAPSVCATGQHGEMLHSVLQMAEIDPDHSLSVMQTGQSLDALTARLIEAIGQVLDAERPDIVVVQGDTASAIASTLAAHYRKIPVAHVEAGLRSGNLFDPWPEESYRRMISQVATLHFAPTAAAHQALLGEGIVEDWVAMVGNTVIDALHWTLDRLKTRPEMASTAHAQIASAEGRSIVLVTAHRRENWGAGLTAITKAVEELSQRPDVQILWPVHGNPAIQSAVAGRLNGNHRVSLTEALSYPDFVALLDACALVLTDSGGVQEEAPAFGKPVLVMRETTERPEGIAAGTARLVGADTTKIVRETNLLLNEAGAYAAMAKANSPYGDGQAVGRIVEQLARFAGTLRA